jgi:hypothetical protein
VRRGRLLAASGIALALAGAWLAIGPPRLTLLNSAVRVDYPAPRGAFALMAAGGLGLLAALLARRARRAALLATAFVAAGAAAHLLLYRVEAGSRDLAVQGVLGSRRVAWSQVASFRLRGDQLLIEADDGRTLSIATGGFRPEQRATLERTLARRVEEGRSP